MAGTNVGWSTLDVIPSVKGLAGELDRQTRGQFVTAGKRAGQQFGDAASREASGRLRSGLRTAFAPAAGLLAGLGGVRIFSDMIAEAQEAAKVGKVTEALIKSTGGAANLSANQVGDLATAMSNYAAVDDELVQSGENVLLTFRNVRNELGQGNDIFNRATKAALDMSTVLGSDLNGAVLQLGKALNDPIKGVTALGRAGVQFSADQKAQIKAFVENNDLLSAQKLVLDELEKQVGGAAGANATALDRLQVSFKNLEEAAGTAAAPALNAFARVATNDVIPAIEGVGGATGDALRFFNALPPEVKTATAALVAFRAAQSLGAGSLLSGGASALSRGLDDIRLRAMALGDEYRRLRQGQLDIIAGSGKFTPAAGRMASALGAIEVAAIGAGRGIRSGLSGALNLVGGPWGAAFIAGTAVVAHFWQEHQKAEARVKEFTATLDAETGALTKSSEEFVRRQLLESGALKAAKDLGLSLSLVTDAALGNESAISAVNAQLQAFLPAQQSAQANGRAFASGLGEQGTAAHRVADAIGGMNGIISQSANDASLLAAAHGQTTSATEKTTTATRNYATELDQARSAVQKLLDKENERRNKNLGAFQDQTRLAQALADARKEAQDGARTLDAGTEAGRKNRDALAGLADAWNSAADKVKNAKGAYADMRQNFIDVAEKMGASETQAKKLADRLLGIPPKTPAQVTTPGMDAALDKVKELNRLLRNAQKQSRIVISAQAGKNFPAVLDAQAHADGGLLRGPGTGTSDSILMWGSNGEFMQRKRAVDYYGVDFMRRLNNLQVPRYAGGGPVGSVAQSSATGGEFRGVLSIDRDGIAYIRGVVREEINAVERARVNGQRLAGMGGTPR